MDKRLIIFTRYPEPGHVKTRLIPVLGADGAANLHRDMTQHTLRWARQLQRQHGVDVEVRFAGGDLLRMKAAFGSDLRYLPQSDGDLGQRLIDALDASACPTVIVGTDCPDLSEQRVLQAFATLVMHDVVLGPASDGGYYLIGMLRPVPALFDGIEWGTATVSIETQHIAARHGLSLALLEILSDVDQPEDLRIWEQAVHRDRTANRGLSP